MKTRKESFWGLHFDFHARPTDEIQGKNLKEEDIREICRELKPDFIQIDCKGHPGWTSYPSSLGNAVPNFEKDTLAIWRKVTREENVALYMHYSGVFDDIFAEFTRSHELVRVKTTNMGSMLKLTYSAELTETVREKEMIDKLRCRNGNLEIVVSQQETVGTEL